MKFSTAAFVALGFLAGNVVSAPTFQSEGVALPVEARAEDFVANVEARANNKAGAGKGNNAGNAAKNKAAAAAAKKNDAAKNAAAAKNNNNNKANAAAAAKGGKSQAEFNGLACTNGKGAGTCNAKGQCTVDGKTAQIADQCGVAAATKTKKRYAADIAALI